MNKYNLNMSKLEFVILSILLIIGFGIILMFIISSISYYSHTYKYKYDNVSGTSNECFMQNNNKYCLIDNNYHWVDKYEEMD